MKEFWKLKIIYEVIQPDRIYWVACRIWDVLSWIEKQMYTDNTKTWIFLEILWIRTDKSESIEKQSKECIDFVFSHIYD